MSRTTVRVSGTVDRNLRLSGIMQTLMQQYFDADGAFLDYGGGYGLVVRLMRERRFDFRSHAAMRRTS